jgi:hypothetical protein
MLTKALVLLFLLLAGSPFTAPFQTFTNPSTVAVALAHDDESGSVVAPLVTKSGRLTIAPPTGLVISPVVVIPLLTLACVSSGPGLQTAARSKVLRL